jgi:ABC-type nitrate/sulfonate/bicarbonate transport system substrate-binding protein
MNASDRIRRHGSALAILSLMVFGAGAAGANELVRVGKAQDIAWTFIPLDVGVAEGLFGKQGLDVEISSLGGDAKVQQALAAGGIEFGLGSGPGMAFAAKGAPAIAVAAFAGPPRNISTIVLADSPIKTVADLKGKLIAVSTVGSLSDWLAKQMAIQEGWGQNGVRTVPLGAAEISVAALRAKRVDAIILSTEVGFGLEGHGQGRIVTTMDHYAPHFITHVVFARKSVIAEKPDLVRRFLDGFFASIAFMKAHRDETSAVAERVLHQSATVVHEDYDSEINMFVGDGRFDRQAVAVLKQSYVDMGTLKQKPPDSAMFTTQFLPIKP